MVFAFCDASMALVTMYVLPSVPLNMSLAEALTVCSLATLGSCTNDLPEYDPGGVSPVVK